MRKNPSRSDGHTRTSPFPTRSSDSKFQETKVMPVDYKDRFLRWGYLMYVVAPGLVIESLTIKTELW